MTALVVAGLQDFGACHQLDFDDANGRLSENPLQVLWNWYTTDLCFIASWWRITSPGMMTNSPIKGGSENGVTPTLARGYRPYIWEQAIRAFLHMTQFAVAYFVMLQVIPSPVPDSSRPSNGLGI